MISKKTLWTLDNANYVKAYRTKRIAADALTCDYSSILTAAGLVRIAIVPRNGNAWMLYDTSNGDQHNTCYVWLFSTRKAARKHKREQNSVPRFARLTGPFRVKVQNV